MSKSEGARIIRENPDKLKEFKLEKFLVGLEKIVFVSETDSVTYRTTEHNPKILDLEAIIQIDAQCDREDLKDLLDSL